MFLDDDKICTILLDYVQYDKTNQAILIDGEWGTGKTYFIQNVFIKRYEESKQRKKLYYVSLYGLTDVNHIEGAIYSKIFERCIAKNASESAIASKTIKVFQKALPVALQALTLRTIGFDGNDALNNIAKEIKPIADAVVIFDDLERCNIELNEILGYINNLVEHNSVKAIILANEQEIWRSGFAENVAGKYTTALAHMQLINELEENDNKKKRLKEISEIREHAEKIFSQDNGYDKVKEKLIGRIIKYRKSLELSYDSVLESVVEDSDTKKILQDCNVVVLNRFTEKKNNNIRTLMSVFTDFQKINKTVQGVKTQHSDFLGKVKVSMLDYLTYCVLKVKMGESLEPWNDRENFTKHIIEPVNGEKQFIFGYKYINDFVSDGYLDEDAFKKELEEYIANAGENDKYKNFIEGESAWHALANWRILEDEDVEKYLTLILKEIKENKYRINDFGSIVMLLVEISKNGFVVDFDAYLAAIENIIENSDKEYISPTGFYAYGSKNVSDEKYREVIQPVLELVEMKNSASKVVKHAFLNTDSWDVNYVMHCQENHNYFINVGKFFAYFDVAVFKKKIKQANAGDIAYFTSAIKEVYSFRNLRDCFKEDATVLAQLLTITELTLKGTTKKTLRLNLTDLSVVMKKFLQILKPGSLTAKL